MKYSKFEHAAMALAAISMVMSSTPAWAYIDPATGGLLFQIATPIITVIVGFFVYLRRAIAKQIARLYYFFRPK